jgi:SAM-dependent methyltransferase
MERREYELMDAAEHRLWWFRVLHLHLTDALVPVQGRVLDAGCGTGGFLARLAAVRPDLVLEGLEFDPAAADIARRKSRADIAQGSILAMPCASARFDAAVSADVLCHHGVDPARALAELRRALKPGGRLILNMPAYAWLASAHDRRVHNARRTTPGEMRRWLAAAGFVRIRIRFWNSLLFPAMVLQRKLLARGDAASDVAMISPGVNAILLAIARIERHLPALPWGGSILAIAQAANSDSDHAE